MSIKDYGRPIDIPVIGVGSQSGMEGDQNLNFTESPGAMHTFDRPILPEPEDVEDLTVAKTVLAKLYNAIKGYKTGESAIAFDISEMDAANVDLINQVFNEGEVSVMYEGNASVQIQESVLTGIWRVRINNEAGLPISDVIEIADIPSIVKEKTFTHATPIDTSLASLPEEAFNAPAILVELAEKMAVWKKGDQHHVINLTLLPLSEADMALLGSRLGVGPITILSRGYGNCRIGSTAKKNIWWVKYFNSDDKIILNTIEVIDIPEVASAAAEDIEDSTERLKDILDVYDVIVE